MALFILIVAGLLLLGWALIRYLDGDPLARLLNELEARDLLGRILAVPRYELIAREILADMDGDK